MEELDINLKKQRTSEGGGGKDKEMNCNIEKEITQLSCMYFSFLSENKAGKRHH
jgi:hypothetical protein